MVTILFAARTAAARTAVAMEVIMGKKSLVRDVMTANPLTLEASSTVFDAARAMRGADVGPIPIVDASGKLTGIVTDRDIVVRAVAEGKDPTATKLADICSREVVVLAPDDQLSDS